MIENNILAQWQMKSTIFYYTNFKGHLQKWKEDNFNGSLILFISEIVISLNNFKQVLYTRGFFNIWEWSYFMYFYIFLVKMNYYNIWRTIVMKFILFHPFVYMIYCNVWGDFQMGYISVLVVVIFHFYWCSFIYAIFFYTIGIL